MCSSDLPDSLKKFVPGVFKIVMVDSVIDHMSHVTLVVTNLKLDRKSVV